MFHPEALPAINAEESHWRTVFFDDFRKPKQTIIVEKHEHNGYTLAELDGTDTDILDHLDDIEGRELSRQAALHLRRQYDHNWAGRDALRTRAEVLWQRGLLRPLGESALTATIDMEGSRQASSFTITVAADGALSTMIDEPALKDTFRGREYHLDWHEYELPRHVSYAVHRVQHRGSARSLPKQVYNPKTIVRKLEDWFEIAVRYAFDGSAS